MRPAAIINQHIKLMRDDFVKFANRLTKELNVGEQTFLSVHTNQNPDTFALFTKLALLKLEYKDWIDPKLSNKVQKNYKLIEKWNETKVKAKSRDFALAKQNSPFRGLGGRQDAIDPTDPVYLQNLLYAEHFKAVEDTIRDMVVTKATKEEITKAILEKVDMNKARAAFWAEDQIQIFNSAIQRKQSVRAGYTHYIWKGGTRESHAIHNGNVYSWNVGVNNLTRPGARHPGEDYRCKCTIQNLTPEQAKAYGAVQEAPRGATPVETLVGNYYGKPSGINIKEGINNILSGLGFKKSSKYIQVATITEAEVYAKEKLNLPSVNYGNEINLQVANNLNMFLTELKTKVGDLPGIEIDNELKELALFIPEKGIIKFNPNSSYWTNGKKMMEYNFKENITSTNSIMHPFYHEYSHYLMRKSGRYQYLQNYRFTESEKELIYTELSENAMENGLEFMAEAYAKIKAGQNLSQRIKSLLDKLGEF